MKHLKFANPTPKGVRYYHNMTSISTGDGSSYDIKARGDLSIEDISFVPEAEWEAQNLAMQNEVARRAALRQCGGSSKGAKEDVGRLVETQKQADVANASALVEREIACGTRDVERR